MSPVTQTEDQKKPKVVSNRFFRSRVRDILVELPNDSPGLGLKVTGDENAIVVYSRAGQRVETFEDAVRLKWYRVDVGDLSPFSGLNFQPMDETEVRGFLRGLVL